MPDRSAAGAPAASAAWPVAIVTDSSASFPGGDRAAGVTVVPLRLLAGDYIADDGATGAAAAIEAAAARGERLTTARPAPAQFAAAYLAAAAAGARAILSVHLSGLLSGTVSSAALAAAAAPVPVRVLDARTIGSGLGLVVVAAAAAARAGQDLDAVGAVAASCADRVGSFFAVDRPDALLAGGRAGAPARGLTSGRAGAGAAAAQPPGCAQQVPGLISRTVLQVSGGRIATVDRVRTWGAAASLLAASAAELMAGRAAGPGAGVVVEHVAAEERAQALADRLTTALPQAGPVSVVTASTAIRIHTGPGMLGVSVLPSHDVA